MEHVLSGMACTMACACETRHTTITMLTETKVPIYYTIQIVGLTSFIYLEA